MADKEKYRKIEQCNQYLNLVDDSVSLYVRQATSDNTRRNYQSDLKHYVEWGGGLGRLSICLAFLTSYYCL